MHTIFSGVLFGFSFVAAGNISNCGYCIGIERNLIIHLKDRIKMKIADLLDKNNKLEKVAQRKKEDYFNEL